MSERELCRVCEGNGVVKIPGGVSVCNHCAGDCWEPQMAAPEVEQLRESLAIFVGAKETEREVTEWVDNEYSRFWARQIAKARDALASRGTEGTE